MDQRVERVEVEGTCLATVTQRCVRTNEDFIVDLEFPLYSIVRPTASLLQEPMISMDNQDDIPNRRKDQWNDNNAKSKNVSRKQDIDEINVLALQQMLQTDVNDEALMEDESIYDTKGTLDVGELVAQLFWLKLDPYLKKPGTDPIQRSITGE